MVSSEIFERERGRLVRIAGRILDDRHEAEDVVQVVWMRLHENTAELENVGAWLTTVTSRLCLDRLRARIPLPIDSTGWGEASGRDPEDAAMQREAVGQALHVVVDRLTPNERVAWVLHESFGFEFDALGDILGRTPAAARKLASRARAKVADAQRGGPVTDRHVVDAFMAAARGSDLMRLLALLAPGASVSADAAAIAAGTPQRIEGREAVAGFFDGSARAALPALVDGRPGAAWFHRGRARVAFDFTVVHGVVEAIVFRAEPDILASVVRRPAEDDTRGFTST
ncbi:sigma-70 family RNA polymerase sigma factor [Rathayibacter iranicus]|uniref:RNA polymerase subunit sigma-70 n=2 Tax=Rathayibacter iranicus TaxID=59737 RepID=A0AAD1AH32_9MICO|nr:sigma-70 family RNA polymerase sigma factor [Rathayibacter iranicus]AZZ56499.1 RNA polymerase subunit sigma-70 [Rathayibacter iranicus]MWV31961.1 sigma-70 family RNA polymerase sigma factor [Rathayibacter iranicus NCPPB 2253 = VKM Ac-1602]PPI58933.1 RNA polymerase subunit sigma-70 [Rathayibacter iranicus]PWJ62488.1 RNA polymerase ECF family sigma subunit [Rathayibacter iranicus NCPPB 2253 = VKM Ac-1602]